MFRLPGSVCIAVALSTACARVPIDLLRIDSASFSPSRAALQIEGDGFPHGQIGRARFTGEQQAGGTTRSIVWTQSAQAVDSNTVLVELEPGSSIETLDGELVLDFEGNDAFAGSLLRGHKHIRLRAAGAATPARVMATSTRARMIDRASSHALASWLTLYLLLLAAYLAFAESESTGINARRGATTVWLALLSAAACAMSTKLIPDELVHWGSSFAFGLRLLLLLSLRAVVETLWLRAGMRRASLVFIAMAVGISSAGLFAPFSHAIGIALLLAVSLKFDIRTPCRRSFALALFSLLVLALPLTQLPKDIEPLIVLLWLYLREGSARILQRLADPVRQNAQSRFTEVAT